MEHDGLAMTTQAPGKKSIKELMRTGEGLSGFAWPETYTDFDIKILRDGTWTYQGSAIEREKLCQLFATILQRDEDGVYWLVTPAERGRIDVEDVPFTAVEMTRSDTDVLHLRTNLGYWITADADHRIRVQSDAKTGAPSPYIHVRDGLEARISRAVFYDMVDLAEERDGHLMLNSGDIWFDLGAIE